MRKEGRPCGRPSVLLRRLPVLRRQLADPCRPVGQRRPDAGPVACATARAQQVVTDAAKERATPGRVIARVSDVLAGDPDRVAVHSSGAVVAPAWANGDARCRGAPLLFVAGKAVLRSRSLSMGTCEGPVTG